MIANAFLKSINSIAQLSRRLSYRLIIGDGRLYNVNAGVPIIVACVFGKEIFICLLYDIIHIYLSECIITLPIKCVAFTIKGNVMSVTIDHTCAVAFSTGTLPLSALASAILQTDIRNACSNLCWFSKNIFYMKSRLFKKMFIFLLTMCCSHPWLLLLAHNISHCVCMGSPLPLHNYRYCQAAHPHGRYSQAHTVCCPIQRWQRINNNNTTPHTYIHPDIHCTYSTYIQSNKVLILLWYQTRFNLHNLGYLKNSFSDTLHLLFPTRSSSHRSYYLHKLKI